MLRDTVQRTGKIIIIIPLFGVKYAKKIRLFHLRAHEDGCCFPEKRKMQGVGYLSKSLYSKGVRDECFQSKHVTFPFKALNINLAPFSSLCTFPFFSMTPNGQMVKPHPVVSKTPRVAVYEIYFPYDSQQYSR